MTIKQNFTKFYKNRIIISILKKQQLLYQIFQLIIQKATYTSVADNYGDGSIKVLEGLDAIRERPGMYVGTSGIEGLHHLIWEILDNSVDEILAKKANEVRLTIKPGHIISIEDNGRGIPVGINKQTGITDLETVFTRLHAGGKFEQKAYTVSGGLHGVGSKCVSALSVWTDVIVWRDGFEYKARFTKGEIDIPTTKVGPTDKQGTYICWCPDFSIMEENDYNIEDITSKIQDLAFLNKGAKFILDNQINGTTQEFLYPEGIKTWIQITNESKTPIHSDVVCLTAEDNVKDRKSQMNTCIINISMQYVAEHTKDIRSFCNNISTRTGGSHLEGFEESIRACISKIAVDEKIVTALDDITKDDIRSGLTAVVSIYYNRPEFSGQTKEKVRNPEIRVCVKEIVTEWFGRLLDDNAELKVIILKRVEDSRNVRLRNEADKTNSKELALDSLLSLPGKLADCTIKSSEISELYIVEGDSAGGSAKGARDREYQAILPLKGKIPNVEKLSDKKKLLANKELKSLIAAIGCSYGRSFDIENLKYNKIIIMTDADVDGSHIRLLLLTFFHNNMKDLITEGHIFIAQPPLYKVSNAKNTKYLFDFEEKEKFLKSLPNPKSYDTNRFKGLGEMSPSQLWETTMNPKTRTLLKVSIGSYETLDGTIKNLMGPKAEKRKQFIIDNYKTADNLDI